MASNADIEKPISLVQPANAKMVQAILSRAHKQEKSADKALARNKNAALRPVRSKGLLSKALGQAMAHHGRTKKGATSLRPKAPDTNGRAFHFSHSTIGKGKAGRRGTTAGVSAGASAGSATAGSSSGASTKDASLGAGPGSPGFPDFGSREAGHQRYVERDAALARDAVEVFGIPVGQASNKGAARDGAGRETEKGWERDPATEKRQSQEKKAKPIEVDIEVLKRDIEQASRGTQSAMAAQEYIEDPRKVAPQTRHGHSNSFGTIGETFDERVAFWTDVIKHEREKDARTQIRLVLELPHEASPAVRQEIVKKFCQQYEDLGVPYWASIHAPTKNNDHRNHHAHIVHGIRPAKRMVDPATGEMAWDFTIAETYRNKTRHKRERHPFRQNVVAAFRDRDYVRDTRRRFAEVTNEVLAAHGYDIRYDPRSYKDMGFDIKPMKHVWRVIADKAKVRDFVVLDAAWTRRLIDQEMKAAAVERDKTYMELKAVEKRLSGLANDIRKLKDVNGKLPDKMKLSPMSRLSVTAAKRLSQKMLEVEHAKIAQRFADEATARTIQHIIDATASVSTHRGGRARKFRPMPDGPEAPNAEAMKVLHASAKEEMRLHRMATAGRARTLRYMAMGVLGQWQEQAQPKATFSQTPPVQSAKTNSTNARRSPHHAASPSTASASGPAQAKPTPKAPDYRAAEAMAQRECKGRPAAGLAVPSASFQAAEAMAREAAQQARPVFRTQAKNVLEILERTSMGGQRFPQRMHDYVNAQTAGVAASVAMAKAAGPTALTALWEGIRQRVGAGEAKATTPPDQTAQAPQAAQAAPAEPQAREPRLWAEPPPVIYVQPTPQRADRREAPVRPGPGSTTSRTTTAQPQPRGTPEGRTATPGPTARGQQAGAGRAQAGSRTPPATATQRQEAFDDGFAPARPAAQPTPEREASPAAPRVRTPEPTTQEPPRPTAPPRAPDVAGVAPKTTAPPEAEAEAQTPRPPQPQQQTQPRPSAPPQRAASPGPELEDLDLEALMRGRYTTGPAVKPKQGRVLRPSDFQPDHKPLSKEGSRWISQMELSQPPPRPNGPSVPRGPKPTEVTEQAAAPPESAVTPEEAVGAKRKKARKRVFTTQKPGMER